MTTDYDKAIEKLRTANELIAEVATHLHETRKTGLGDRLRDMGFRLETVISILVISEEETRPVGGK